MHQSSSCSLRPLGSSNGPAGKEGQFSGASGTCDPGSLPLALKRLLNLLKPEPCFHSQPEIPFSPLVGELQGAHPSSIPVLPLSPSGSEAWSPGAASCWNAAKGNAPVSEGGCLAQGKGAGWHGHLGAGLGIEEPHSDLA